MEDRAYQEESINNTRRALRQHDKVILQLPTGSGKTYVASEIVKKARKKRKRVSFICDRLTLIDQTSQEFYKFGIDHGVIQGDHPLTDYSKPVQLCSIQTLARRGFPPSDIVIVDEAHTMYKAQLDMLAKWNSKFIGLTATPYSKGLGLHWEHLIVGATTRQLIDAGYLSDFIVYAPPPPDLTGVGVQRGDYVQSQLASRMNQVEPVGDIVQTWFKHGENNQTICFAVNVEHSKHIVSEFNKAGVPAVHVDAYDDPSDRRRAIRDYKDQKVKLISCVDILTKGFDEPHTGTLIMGRPTRSLIVHLQQIGRVLRIAEGLGDAVILDHGANVERHGFPTDETLPVTLDRTPPSGKMKDREAERLPKHCPKCNFVKAAGQHECPMCGFKPERINTVTHEEGELVRVKGKIVPRETRQQFYSGLLGYAMNKGFSQGWAAHTYRDKYKEWPNDLQKRPMAPDADVRNYVTYMAIRRSKRK